MQIFLNFGESAVPVQNSGRHSPGKSDSRVAEKGLTGLRSRTDCVRPRRQNGLGSSGYLGQQRPPGGDEDP